LDTTGRLSWLAAAAAVVAVWELTGRCSVAVKRQVNEEWLGAYRGWIYGVGFGAQLGMAVVTVVNTALIPMFMAAALLTGRPVDGLIIGAVFGLTRGLSVTLNAGVRDAVMLRDLHRRLDDLARTARLIGAAVAAALGVAAGVAAAL